MCCLQYHKIKGHDERGRNLLTFFWMSDIRFPLNNHKQYSAKYNKISGCHGDICSISINGVVIPNPIYYIYIASVIGP